MCIAAVSDARELAQRPCDVDEVGDDLDGVHRRGLRVRPAGELVQIVADAGDLPHPASTPGGADRLFGPRTRAAIRNRQSIEDVLAYGYGEPDDASNGGGRV